MSSNDLVQDQQGVRTTAPVGLSQLYNMWGVNTLDVLLRKRASDVVSSSSDESTSSITSISLSFTDGLTETPVSLALVADGNVLSPAQLRAQIMRVLKLIKRQKLFFGHHRRQQALPPLGCVVDECSPCGRVRLMLPCVAFACQRLATAPAGMANMPCSWAELVMDSVTRGRVKKVQVQLQQHACCAVRCACRASACVRCVFDACCRKLWLVLRCVAAQCSGCIKRAAAFILVCRLLPPPALQVDATF